MDTSGFYKDDNGPLIYGPNFVTGPDFNLDRNVPADRSRIVDGWQWFDYESQAYAAYGITAPAA